MSLTVISIIKTLILNFKIPKKSAIINLPADMMKIHMIKIHYYSNNKIKSNYLKPCYKKNKKKKQNI